MTIVINNYPNYTHFNTHQIHKFGMKLNIELLESTNPLKIQAVTQSSRIAGRPYYSVGFSSETFQLCFNSIMWEYKMSKM